jgi:hypothetical protein
MNVILPFHLLEDLAVTTFPTTSADDDDSDRLSTAVQLSSSAMSTGGLEFLLGTTKLEDVVFRPGLRRVERVTVALQTTTSKHRDLQQTTVHMPRDLTLAGLGAGGWSWSDSTSHRQLETCTHRARRSMEPTTP